jgi:transposase
MASVKLARMPMNRELFELYVETQLAPTLSRGDVVILDNLSSHKSVKAAEMLRAVGAWFLFLRNPTPRAALRRRLDIAFVGDR